MSHETIYRSLYVQARGVLKKELAHLRSQRQIRRSRHAKQEGRSARPNRNAVSISERPASVDDRAVPGHWEGDLLCGPKNSFIVTLVERHSRYVMLAKVPNSDTETVVNALIKQAQATSRRTLQIADLGSRQRTCRSSSASPWKPTSPSISAIRKAPGSAAQTKTPTGCCASTCQKDGSWRGTLRPSSTKSRATSTSDREKRWTSTPPQSDLASVLRRSVETAAVSGH